MLSPRCAACLALVFLGSSARAQVPTGCQPDWLPTFGPVPGTDGAVLATAVFDDGSGPALYIAGGFSTACGTAANGVAKWNGSSWSALSSGVVNNYGPTSVRALAAYDDGGGLALYAAGGFSSAGGIAANNIAKWTGSSWSAVGGGLGTTSMNIPAAYALAVFDDGGGPALFVGGTFPTAGGVPVSGIAKWDGTSWSAVGSGVGGAVLALIVHDDGSGPALFAAGGFETAGGAPAKNIAKWNGASWSALGSGVGGSSSSAYIAALAVHDDGGGNALYAGGSFPSAGGLPANDIAKWNGTSWSSLGSGVTGGLNSGVLSLRTYDPGGGPQLCAGGWFSSAGGLAVDGIASWNGSSWAAVGAVTGSPIYVATLAVYDPGSGQLLCVGGSFAAVGGQQANYVARWNGAAWSGFASGLSASVEALTVFDGGGGPELYVGGDFTNIEGTPAVRVAKWNGASWSALGSGTDGSVEALAAFDDGSGPALYACGRFLTAGGVSANGIAKWDGSAWSALGGGLTMIIHPADPRALAVFDDGSGPALYVTGQFSYAGGTQVSGLARWDGTSWSAVGTLGLDGYALAVFDDGSGPALYAGGSNGIARWDGSSATWLVVSGYFPTVYSLAVYDEGSGTALYAGGRFNAAGPVAANNIARWSGSSWSALGTGVGGPDDSVFSLVGFDDGGGPAMYAGGWFSSAGGTPANGIARWNGASWSALGAGVNSLVSALATFDDGRSPALFAGGWFTVSPAGDSYLAKWGNPAGCGAPGSVVCEPGVGGVSACPCGNPPAGAGRGCNNSSNTGGAQLGASGIARLTYDSVRFTTSGETPSATSIVLQGDALNAGGATFGQGVRCVAGSLKRLYVKSASGGSIRAPSPSDPRVHARSAALGDPIAPGMHRFYGVYYRDPQVLGGCPATSTFDVTQQLDVLWSQ
jgi:hypothetical protein